VEGGSGDDELEEPVIEAELAEPEPIPTREFATVAVFEAVAHQRETSERGPTDARKRRLEDLAAPRSREAAQARRDLRQQLELAVKARLGPNFTVLRLELYGGSLELLAVVGMVGTAVQGYGSVREGLELLVKDFQRVIARVLRRHGLEDVETPEVTWSPGHALMSDGEPDPATRSRASRLLGERDPLLAYFLMVHFLVLLVILGVVVVLLVDSV
jgi:hypothetical protein